MDEIRDRSLSEGCEPLRTTLRVVGFKVADYSPSPTSVLTSRESQGARNDSPRSKLAEALRVEAFHPLPRLRLKSTPKQQVPGFRKSLSHADLHNRDLALPSDRNEPATPGSRASTASTPMKIPSTMSRVQTCPIDLSDYTGATFKAATQLPETLPSRATAAASAANHARRHSEVSSSSCLSIEEGDDCDGEHDSLARDLFQAASLATAHAEENNCSCASQEEDTVSAAAAVVDFGNLRVSEASSSNSALPPPPPATKLRLPLAAVHRRVRSLEAMLPRPSN